MKIKDIIKEDRPRERYLEVGVENLSNEELVALLLKSGTTHLSAKELASYLLNYCQGLDHLSNITYEELIKIKGIGIAKATTIMAAIELSHRFKMVKLDKQVLNSASLIYDYYKLKLVDKKQEYFYVLYLDTNKQLLKEKLLFIGTVNHTLVHPRDIFKEAYLLSATSFICIHNHPGGSLKPSADDLKTTNNLVAIGKMMGLYLDDHIIISANGYFSFFEHNLL